jgi:hypothetical protein
VLDAVDTHEPGRVDLVGRHRHADRVSELDHAALLEVRQAHVEFDQVVPENPRALQLHLEMGRAGDRQPHLVVDAVPFHQVAGRVHARAGADSRLDGLALLGGLVRGPTRAPDRGDAERQPGPTLRLAEVRLEVRMELDQARHHGES